MAAIRLPVMLIVAALAGFNAQPARAQAPLNLKGKTVTTYVAGGVGGGVDNFARTLAPYLGKHLPGEPTVVASNMPGGGGVQAVQYLYNIAAKDGTAIGTTNAGPIVEPLLGTATLNYDLQKFRWIGSLVKGDTVCSVWHLSGIKTLADAKTREVPLTSTGVTASPTRSALLMNALIGTRFKPIAGYDGGTSLLAIERGESAGICITLNSLRTTRPDWLRDKKIVPLVQVSLSADPEFPDVPRAADLIGDPDHRQMLDFFMLPYEFNNPFYLPPGVSDEVLAAYRVAFEAAIRDPSYLAEAAKRRQTITPRDGADVTNLVDKLLATPKAIVRRTIEATTP
jgi:tripartite-type tricarboxylate transporter receptor subunit TctC